LTDKRANDLTCNGEKARYMQIPCRF